jgi:Zn-dependent M28 family amino/carboxypeptidase
MRKSLIAATCVALAASAGYGTFVEGAVGVDSTKLRDAVKVSNMRLHQAALQAIADVFENEGTRASGTPGFAASADYVRDQLVLAGYAVVEQPFDFPFFEELSPAEFDQTSPNIVSYVLNTDFATMEYSGRSDDNGVTAVVQAVDLVLPPGAAASTSNSGCEAADFTGFVAGNIALIQRGTCTFALKAQNAEAKGASAVIIFNEGTPGQPDRIELLNGTLGGPVGIPVIGTTFALGNDLAALASPTVHIKVDATSEIRTTKNIIAETASGRSDRVVAVGAHLDSVAEGPGINDNGSGSAGILEIAIQMAKLNVKPVNKVRFLWFGAEEAGLLGSAHYVASLTARQKKDIAMNLNFDMIGSPNYVRFVYDGDGSSTPAAGPNGSATIEDVFAKYFAKVGLPFEPTAFDGRSDYGPFIDAGIPAGGLFTGAEDPKTAAEAAIYGGLVGEQHDPCYHAACDNYITIYGDTNDDFEPEVVFEQMGDAAADAILQFAMTTSAVKGTSKANDRAIKSVAADSLLYRGGHLQK